MADKKKRTPFARKLKSLRDRLGLTQAQAAARTDVPLRTWVSWENDQRKPGRLTMRLLREAFPEDFPPEKK